MSVLYDTMSKFNREWLNKNGKLTPVIMQKWYGEKYAKKRSFEEMIFTEKSAVVALGVSGVGKTTWIQNFIKENPNFTLISYDECAAMAMTEVGYERDAVGMKALEIIDKQLKENKDSNIVIDGKFVHPATRASLFEILNKVYKYQIHIVYFSFRYVGEHIHDYFLSRAVEYALFDRYVKSNVQPGECSDLDLYKLRNNMLEVYAKENNLTKEHIIDLFANDYDVQVELSNICREFQKEIAISEFVLQERFGFYRYGADYVYIL